MSFLSNSERTCHAWYAATAATADAPATMFSFILRYTGIMSLVIYVGARSIVLLAAPDVDGHGAYVRRSKLLRLRVRLLPAVLIAQRSGTTNDVSARMVCAVIERAQSQ